MITEILLSVVVILLAVLIFLVLRGRGVKPREIEDAVSSTWTRLGLEEKIGMLTAHTQDIRDCHRSIEQMLRVPKERAALGELSLETILSDQLSPDMFGIRKSVLDGKVPDAHIRSTVGLICIDSKFPLDNYRSMVETEDSREREGFKTNFRRDVRNHLNKIAQDYVCPDKGSAEFAFAYIPSEGVYYFLVSEEFEMLRDYARKGVQVVSPLTLCHKVELIKAGVHARKLSEEAENVRNDLSTISQRFNEVDGLWRVFYSTHLRNAGERAEELDRAYKRLRDEFDRVSRMSKE
jgi:DNA recombination protein RmuC